MLPAMEKQDTNQPLVTTLGARDGDQHLLPADQPDRHRELREAFPDLPDKPDQKTVFLKLRELRNKW